MDWKKLLDETTAKKKSVMQFIDSFIDQASFVETDVLLKTVTPLGEAAGEGVVGGFATVDGTQVAVFATNPEVLKGSIGSAASKKITRIVQNAIKAGAPVIAVLDTAGARFAEGVEAVEGYASILGAYAQAYGTVPTIAVIKGNNFGMLGYLAAFSDVVVAMDKAVMSTASPLIVSAKAGVGAETVGTTQAHAADGLYSAVVKNEKELKDILVKTVGYLTDPVREPSDDPNRVGKPKSNEPKAVIAEVFDKGSFTEVKGGCAPEIVTGFARLNGCAVGVVAGNGNRLSAEGANKVTELLTTCASFDLPIVNLVDCVGTVVDVQAEHGSLIREVGNMIFAYARTEVPKFAVVTGSAIGAGYAAFAGKNVCDYTAAWNTAKIGIVESTAAAELLYAAEIAKAKDKAKAEAQFAQTYADENQSAAVAAAAGYIDNVIEPSQTRPYLIAALQAYGRR